MNANQALAKARKLYGKNAYVEIRRNAPDAEERVQLKAATTDAAHALAAAKAERDQLRRELLSDPRYVALCQKVQDADAAHVKLLGRLYTYRVEIGVRTYHEIFTSRSVKVRADSLDEAFNEAKRS